MSLHKNAHKNVYWLVKVALSEKACDKLAQIV